MVSIDLSVAANRGMSQRLTPDLPCCEVFAREQKTIEVIGTVGKAENEIAASHRSFRRAH